MSESVEVEAEKDKPSALLEMSVEDPGGEAPPVEEPNDPDFIMEDADGTGEDEGAEDEAEAEAEAEVEAENDGRRLHVTLKQEGIKDYYLQKYKPEWEDLPEFKAWLQPVPNDQYKAECIMCSTFLRCHKLKLRQHAKSKKHHMNMAAGGRAPCRLSAALSSPRCERRSFGRRVGGPPRGRGRGVWTPRPRPADTQGDSLGPQDVSYSDTGRITFSIGLGGNKVGFIGAGVIAQAIARAILDKGVIHSGRLTVSAPSARHLSKWTAWGSSVTNSNDVVMQTCDMVFLCVPPAAALAALHALTPVPDIGERCFISVVPGLSREDIETVLASKFVPPCGPDEIQTMGSMYVIRCMMNLAVRTGTGCCAYSLPATLPDRWLLCLEVMCGSLGVSQPLPDQQLDAFAAAFTPGPAFALAFSEALALGAASAGLPWPIARKMAAQTLLGTGQLLLDSDKPSALHDQSAPAGGATIAALVALQQTGLKSGMAAAVQACVKAMHGAKD